MNLPSRWKQNRLAYLVSLALPLLTITGIHVGGWMTVTGLATAFVLYPLLDLTLGESEGTNLEHLHPLFFDVILYLHCMLQLVSVLVLLRFAHHEGYSVFFWCAALSSGTSAGTSGIVIAHELIHRKQGWKKTMGIVVLWTVSYMHFYIEHIRGHHKWVATSKDSASATVTQGLWSFILSTIPRQWLSSFRLKPGMAITFLAVEISTLAILFWAYGEIVAVAWITQSAMAIFLLEYVNYIRHWGLRREPDQKVEAWHSWQSLNRWSRWTLVELTLHADHHITASKEYWKLQVFEGPRLPSGYFACFYLALIPPIWKAVMRKRLPV